MTDSRHRPSPEPREALQRSAEASPDLRRALAAALSRLRRSLGALAVFSLALNLLVLAVPIYLFQISDRVLTSHSTDTLLVLTVIVIVCVLAYAVLDTLRRMILMRVAVRFETMLAAPVLTAAIRATPDGDAGALHAVGDLQQLRGFLTSPTVLLLFDVPVVPIYFLVVYLVHPDLGHIMLGAAVVTLALALLNQRATRRSFAMAGARAMQAAGHVDAAGRAAFTINSMGMAPETVRLWAQELGASLGALVRAQDANSVLSGLSKFVRMLVQVAILGWGARLALSGELTGGMMIAASIISGRGLAPLEGAIEGWRSYVLAQASYGRVVALLRNSPLNLQRLRLPDPSGRLRVQRLLYAPPPSKRVLLNGIDFELAPGEILGVIGPSGAGKSTLARLLIGAAAPTAGEVRLSELELRHWDPGQFGDVLGYLPQDVQLYPASVKANIARLRATATDDEIFAAARMAGIHEMIARLPQGYETVLTASGAPLSGGQRQRLGLARALFGTPRLVVLDEPNANLDSEGDAALARALRLGKAKGITMVAITQRHALLRHVDKVLVLDGGQMVHFGPRDAVLLKVYGAAGADLIADGKRAARGPKETRNDIA